jgi:hypothetical protein
VEEQRTQTIRERISKWKKEYARIEIDQEEPQTSTVDLNATSTHPDDIDDRIPDYLIQDAIVALRKPRIPMEYMNNIPLDPEERRMSTNPHEALFRYKTGDEDKEWTKQVWYRHRNSNAHILSAAAKWNDNNPIEADEEGQMGTPRWEREHEGCMAIIDRERKERRKCDIKERYYECGCDRQCTVIVQKEAKRKQPKSTFMCGMQISYGTNLCESAECQYTHLPNTPAPTTVFCYCQGRNGLRNTCFSSIHKKD